MNDKLDRSELSASALLADIDSKLDRLTSMGAATTTHVKRLADLRDSEARLGDPDRQNLRQLLPQVVRVMSQLKESRTMMFARMTAEDIALSFDKPRIDAARRLLRDAEETGTELVRHKRDDSITLRVEIPVDASRKKLKKMAKETLKLLLAGGAAYVAKRLGILP